MSDLVVKTNRLNSVIQNLSLAEVRIVQLAIVDARETGRGLDASTPLCIDAVRFADVFNTTRENAYTRLKDAEKTLFERRFSFLDDDNDLVKSRWISQVKYLKNKGGIEIIFTPAVVKEISRLDGKEQFFTSYLLKQTATMKSSYAVRLYELLIQWKSTKKTPMFDVAKFRKQLGLDVTEYKTMSNFKKRVLDLAVKEINEKSDITTKYEQVKKGNTISGFIFTLDFKEKPKDEKAKQNNQVLSDFASVKSTKLFKNGLSDNQIKKLAVYKKEFIDANIHLVQNDERGYAEIFESWKVKLANKESVNDFVSIAEILAKKNQGKDIIIDTIKTTKNNTERELESLIAEQQEKIRQLEYEQKLNAFNAMSDDDKNIVLDNISDILSSRDKVVFDAVRDQNVYHSFDFFKDNLDKVM